MSEENSAAAEAPAVTIERRGHVLLVGLNRPAKRNAFNLAMMHELALAYGEIENDPEIRVGVVFAHGEHFTGGLDLAEVAPVFGEPEQVDPRGRSRPVAQRRHALDHADDRRRARPELHRRRSS